MRRPRKIVEVTWVDAQTPDHGGWEDASILERFKNQGALATTLGFLISRDKNGIAVAASITYDLEGEVDQISGTFIIPAGMIRKVRILK